MSCFYKALPRLIPQLLLLARPGSEIILVSPWMEDVVLYPPIFGQGERRYTCSKIRLSQLLLRLARDYKIRITFILREQDERSARVITPLITNQPSYLTVKQVQHIHAKMLITEAFLLKTSANLLWTSLHRNIESCTLVSNPYGNPRQCLKVELGVII
jgi:hypothetical protein